MEFDLSSNPEKLTDERQYTVVETQFTSDKLPEW